MSSRPMKFGSAPAGVGVDPSAWRVSPLRKPNRGIGMDSERKSGVLHRIDSQIGFHSTSNLDRVEQQLRCPSCRLFCQMLCPNCVSTILRLSRLRDVHHQLFLRKAEVCQKIDRELQSKMNFQSDTYTRARSINQLKQTIIDKRNSIDRLRRTLALMDVKIVKSSKNVQTLENAAIRHMKLIEQTNLQKEAMLASLEKIQEDILGYKRFFTILLAHYFPLKKTEIYAKSTQISDSMVASSMSAPQPNVWPPVKKYFFTMNGCNINENGQYDRLESELISGSPLVLSSRARLSFAALLYLTQFLNAIAFLLDFNLPYRLPLRELAVWSRWNSGLFATDNFRLNTNIMSLCAAYGLKNEILAVNNPFNNLLLFIQELQKNKISTTRGLLTEQMKHKLAIAFKQFKYEERLHEFNLEHVEDDWVSVDLANT